VVSRSRSWSPVFLAWSPCLLLFGLPLLLLLLLLLLWCPSICVLLNDLAVDPLNRRSWQIFPRNLATEAIPTGVG
jgi:hypothetical protein